ncbi:MAG: PAS domain-containing protein [Chloroflexota bacterium]|nr:PAS domain-containing protein [Chloroflexota bacterium]
MIIDKTTPSLIEQITHALDESSATDAAHLRNLLSDARAQLTEADTHIRALSDERDLLRLLIDFIPRTSIYIKDVNGRKTYANLTDAQMMGMNSPEEALGKFDHDVYAPDVAAHSEADDRFVLDTRQTIIDREEILMDQYGTETWWLTNKQPLYDRDGNLIGLIGTGRDITARKKVEDQLRQSEHEYKALFDAALRQAQELTLLDQVRTILAREIDLVTLVRTICEAIAQTFGYTHISIYLLEGNDLVMQYQIGYATVIPRLTTDEGVSGRVVRTGKPVLLEDIQNDPDFVAAVSGLSSEICVPLFDTERVVGTLNIEAVAGGKPLTHADLDLMIALSEHVSVAINRARLVDDVRESEVQTRALLDAIPDMIIRFDGEGRYLFLKPEQNDNLFLPIEAVVGKTLSDVMPPEVAVRAVDAVHAVLKTQMTQVVEYSLSINGALRDFEARMVVSGRNEILAIVRDVTDQKNAERNRQESERMRILKALFDDVSHDLRTPVASIVTSIYLIQKQNERLLQHADLLKAQLQAGDPALIALASPNLNEMLNAGTRVRDQTHSLDQSAWRLRRMVESMMDMARLDGEIVYTFRIEDMNRIVQRAVDVMQPIAADKGVFLAYQPPDLSPLVNLHEAEFSRVVQNLIDNAINYTPSGGSVSVRLVADDQYASLDVRDTGIGIAADDLPHIFNRLYRADKARGTRGGGMGLGLAICKKIVDAHGGDINVESHIGVGSVFRVRLPIPS